MTALLALLDHVCADPAAALVSLADRLDPGVRRECAAARPASPSAHAAAHALARHVAVHGSADDRLRLLSPTGPLDPDIAELLLRAPEPAIRVAAYRHPETPPHLLRALLAGDPPPDVVRMLLGVRGNRRLLAPALAAADPALAAHAARVVRGPRRAAPPRDPAGVHAWLRVRRPDEGATRGIRPSPTLRRARARVAAVPFEEWTPGDWACFAGLNARDPIDPVTASLVAVAPGCPPELVLAFAFTELPDPSFRPDAAIAVMALKTGRFSFEDVCVRAPGAGTVLRLLPHLWSLWRGRASAADRAARAGLAAAVRDHLGADPARWAGALTLLDGPFPGTVPELLAAAARHPASAERPATPPPPASRAPYALAALLGMAGDDVFGAVMAEPALRTAVSLVVQNLDTTTVRLPDALIRAYVAAASEDERVELGRRGGRVTTAEFLWSLDDPACNHGMTLGYGLPAAIHRRIRTGTAHATGRPGTLALHPDLLAAEKPHKTGVLTPDADHVVRVLGSYSHLSAAYRAEGIRRLLELERPDLAAPFLRQDGSGLAEALATPLARGDVPAALAALDVHARELFRADLTHDRVGDVGCHFELGRADPAIVEELLAAGELPARAARTVANHLAYGFPDHVASALLVAVPDEAATELLGRTPEFTRAALAAAPMGRIRHTVVRLVREGHIDPREVLAHGRPARDVLTTLAGLPPDRAPRDVGALASGEALVAAAALLPDFVGTVPELLATARAMTS